VTATLEQKIHDEATQRLTATGVATLYGVKLKVIAAAIEAKPNTLQKNPASESVQKGLSVLVDCFTRLYVAMSQDETAVRRWLNRPNRGLDGLQPMQLLHDARLSDFKAVVLQLETAGYA